MLPVMTLSPALAVQLINWTKLWIFILRCWIEISSQASTHGKFLSKICAEMDKLQKQKGFLLSMVCVGETVSREIYSSVINRYRLEKNLRKTAELMQAMQQSGFEPDFETHWSLISNLSNSSDKDNANSNRGFLARLLSSSGFSRQRDSRPNWVNTVIIHSFFLYRLVVNC
ncbi:hypothetical protein GBA52_025823 [Prunus armeniaca]|nr:hypothetical protein GBA52_025823 [Prunus armeniaca]